MKPNYCIGCVKECNGFTRRRYGRCPLGIISEAKEKGVALVDITHPAECRAVPMRLTAVKPLRR